MNLDDLIKKLESPDTKVVNQSLDEIGDLNSPDAVPFLLDFLERKLGNSDLVDGIIWTLGRIAPLSKLILLLKHPNKNVVKNVIDALGRREEKDSIPYLLLFLEQEDSELRSLATWALGRTRSQRTQEYLLERLLTDEDAETRAQAAWGLGNLSNPKMLHILEKVQLKEKDDSVLYYLNDSIEKIRTQVSMAQSEHSLLEYECSKLEMDCKDKVKTEKIVEDEDIHLKIEICAECEKRTICSIQVKKRRTGSSI